MKPSFRNWLKIGGGFILASLCIVDRFKFLTQIGAWIEDIK